MDFNNINIGCQGRVKTGIDTICQPLFLYILLPYHLSSILHVDAMLGCVLDRTALEVEEQIGL